MAFNISSNKAVNCTHSYSHFLSTIKPQYNNNLLSTIPRHILIHNCPPPPFLPINPFPPNPTSLPHIFPHISIFHPYIILFPSSPCPTSAIFKTPMLQLQYIEVNQLFQTTILMCFLKHIKNISQDPLDSSPHSKHQKSQSDTENLSSQEMLSNYKQKSQLLPKFDSNYFLMNCLGLMNFNSQILKKLDQKLISTEESLTSSFDYLAHSTQGNSQNGLKRKASITQNIPQKVEQNLQVAINPLTQQLFGLQHYRYRLELAREFSDVLYKERNFAISVKLVDIVSGKEKRNGNLINLCVSVCDKEGEWINETKQGIAFIKGKVETELYHGQGEFCKLAPKDVSRSFPDKTVNLVIYCKPSLLKYSGETTLEQNIDYRMIEPLIIKDISIKAKKRQ